MARLWRKGIPIVNFLIKWNGERGQKLRPAISGPRDIRFCLRFRDLPLTYR
jgi:hypothetical protein